MLGAALGDPVSVVPLELEMFLSEIAFLTITWIYYRIVSQVRTIRWLSSTLGMSLSTLVALVFVIALDILVLVMSGLTWYFLVDISPKFGELVSFEKGLFAMATIICM
jgi:hypothetical protein